MAEKWSEREHVHLNGDMLPFLCWLFAILIPVVMPLAFHFLRWITALAIVTILCFVPSLLCKFRYTAGRRAALNEHYRGLKPPPEKACQHHSCSRSPDAG